MRRPLNHSEEKFLNGFIERSDDCNGVLIEAYVLNEHIIYYEIASSIDITQGILLLRN